MIMLPCTKILSVSLLLSPNLSDFTTRQSIRSKPSQIPFSWCPVKVMPIHPLESSLDTTSFRKSILSVPPLCVSSPCSALQGYTCHYSLEHRAKCVVHLLQMSGTCTGFHVCIGELHNHTSRAEIQNQNPIQEWDLWKMSIHSSPHLQQTSLMDHQQS